MKLHKLVVVMALCGAAFGQVTLNCPHCAIGPLSYSTVLNTDSVSKGVILNNTDMSAVPLTWSIAGAGFLPGWITCKSGSIAPGKCTISVKFHPTVAGNATGTLTINAGTPNVTTVVQLNGTTPASAAKFVIGDRVIVATDPTGVSVRATGTAGGALLGTQFNGALGTVTAGPTLDPTDTSIITTGRIRWQINYDLGVDGWSPEDCLNKSSTPAPITKNVKLNWNASVPTATLPGIAATYNLYREVSGGSYAKVGSVTANILTFTDAAVPAGTYQYIARAATSAGQESTDSNPVTVTIQ